MDDVRLLKRLKELFNHSLDEGESQLLVLLHRVVQGLPEQL